MFTGLARTEEFPFITYYCPHCNALNKPKNSVLSSDTTYPVSESATIASENVEQKSESIGQKISATKSPVVATMEEKEASEKKVAEDQNPDPESH